MNSRCLGFFPRACSSIRTKEMVRHGTFWIKEVRIHGICEPWYWLDKIVAGMLRGHPSFFRGGRWLRRVPHLFKHDTWSLLTAVRRFANSHRVFELVCDCESKDNAKRAIFSSGRLNCGIISPWLARRSPRTGKEDKKSEYAHFTL